MEAIQWGNVAEWVGGIGTAGAFLLTYLLLRHELDSRRQMRESAEREQATQVTVWVQPLRMSTQPAGWLGMPTLHVGNASAAPVSAVKAAAVSNGLSGVRVGNFWTVLAAGTVDVAVPHHGLSLDAKTDLRFTDAGLYWHRSAAGDLQRVSVPAEP